MNNRPKKRQTEPAAHPGAADAAGPDLPARIAHTIRAPLAIITSLIEVIMAGDPDPEIQKLIPAGRAATRDLTHLVDDLMDLSQTASGTLPKAPRDFDLKQLLTALAEEAPLFTWRADLRLSVHIAPKVPATLRVDTHRLGRVIRNLIKAAAIHSHWDRFMLRVSDDGTDGDARRIAFEIQSQGMGQAPVNDGNDRIRDRRLNDAGLNIHLARELILAMGGDPWPPDAGPETGFCFFLPMEAAIAGRGGPEPAPAGPHPRRLEILLVEDNPLNQRLALLMLGEGGHSVTVAENGAVAVKAVEKQVFDIILMDIQMPVMDGLEASRRIRRIPGRGHIPILAVTAHLIEEDVDQVYAAGMNACLNKPLRREIFLETIEKLSLPATGAEPRPSAPAPKGTDCESMEAMIYTKSEPPESAAPSDRSVNTTKDALEILDRSMLFSIVGGNTDLIRELVNLFWENLPTQIARIDEAIASDSPEQVQYWAHALKGMSLNLSARHMADIALQIEQQGRTRDLSRAPALKAELDAAVHRLKSATRELVAELEAREGAGEKS